MMTAKDYRLIASVLNNVLTRGNDDGYPSSSDRETIKVISRSLAAKLAMDNPRFNVGKFLAAVGI